jgi:pimeloyl-ACP methyl ester carboxylesterase
MQTEILYLSGFGDHYDWIRRFTLGFWKLYGVNVRLIPTSWSNQENYEEKFKRITNAIDAIDTKTTKVVLIGESAGGSLAINVFARRKEKIHKTITICGKNSGPDSVAPHYYKRNPTFRNSMNDLNKSVAALSKQDRRRVVSIYPLYDSIVPIRETLIPDCKQIRLPIIGHLFTIFFTLTFGAYFIAKLAKN